MATKLEDICESLGIPAKVVETQVGPQLYRVKLEPGRNGRGKRTRLCTIKNRAPDIGLAIGAYPINTTQDHEGFWLEIPSETRKPVHLAHITDRAMMGKRLPIALGIDIKNQPLVIDLAEANTPHMLVAGTTGSGKTVLLKAVLTSLLRHDNDWHMAVVDTKQDLDVLAGSCRHVHFFEALSKKRGWLGTALFGDGNRTVSHGVITTPAMAETVLDGLYQQCQARQTRGIDEPRILVVVDEYADLALASKEIMKKTVRLAQVGRSAGIHMILATQRPSVKVVNGLIKANFPVRVALKVVTKTDSRVILDTAGAEKLLGKGDGLVLLNGELVRFQGAYVSDDVVRRAVREDNEPHVEVVR